MINETQQTYAHPTDIVRLAIIAKVYQEEDGSVRFEIGAKSIDENMLKTELGIGLNQILKAGVADFLEDIRAAAAKINEE